MGDLVDQLIAEGVLKTSRIIEAFRRVKRIDFLPAEVAVEAGQNRPVPIGFGQTNSQPLTVAFMLELLQPKAGERILDIGAGSGWTTALLADLAGPTGSVWAVERVPSLARSATKRLQANGFSHIRVQAADGSQGWPEAAPYDVIHVAAAAARIPGQLVDQLKTGGRLIMPIGNPMTQSLCLVRKRADGAVTEERFPGFVFVPLVENNE